MTDTIKIRCSALPRVIACPPSIVPPEVPIQSESGASILGTAIHAAIAERLGKEPDAEGRKALDALDDEQSKECRILTAMAMRTWRVYEPHLLDIETEVKAKADVFGVTLTGTADVAAMTDDGQPVVIDWKSGYVDRDYAEQLNGYAALALSRRPADYATVIVAWLRTGDVDVRKVDVGECEAWEKGLACIVRSAAKAPYNPDQDRCQYCPRAHECPAWAAYRREAVKALVPFGDAGLPTREKLAELYPQAQALTKALDAYKSALKAALDVGPLPTGDGRELYHRESKRDTIILADAWDALQEAFGVEAVPRPGIMDALGDAVSVKKGAILDAAAAQAERGGMAKAKREVMQKLEEAGAVRTTAFSAIATRKVSKKEEVEDV